MMTDLAVKVFMAANNLTDFDVAQNIMYKYGLADKYVGFAEALEPLLNVEDGFVEGMEFVTDIVNSMQFHLPPECAGTEFVHGIQFAMTQVTELLKKGLEGAKAPAINPADFSPEKVSDLIATIFSREPSKG